MAGESAHRQAVLTILLSLGVFGLGYIGSLPDPFVSPIWPATGFQIAMYFRFGRRALWAMTPGLLAIQLQLGLQGGLALLPALLFAAVSWSGMVTEAVIAHRVTRPGAAGMSDQTTYLRFATLGAPLGTLSSALQGVSVLLLFDAYAPSIEFYVPYLVWWSGNLIGAYVLVPLLTLTRTELDRLRNAAPLLVAALGVAGGIIFGMSFIDDLQAQKILVLGLVLLIFLVIQRQDHASMVVLLSAAASFYIVLNVNRYVVANAGHNIFDLFTLEATLALSLSLSMIVFHLARAKSELADRIGRDNERLQSLVDQQTQHLAMEIEQKEATEARLLRTHELLTSIDNLRSEFIRDVNPFRMYDSMLGELLRLTHSEYGFIGELRHDEDGQPYLKLYALTDLSWDDQSRELHARLEQDGFEFRAMDNLIGACVISERLVIANEPGKDSRASGLPKGHPTIDSFMGIPVCYGDRLVGEIGFANRRGGFDSELADYVRPAIDALGQIIVARWDREARSEAERELTHLAVTDPLTGIANRRQFDLHLERLVAESDRHSGELCCLMMDIDHFKLINDRHGHETGDQILVEFAQVVSHLVRKSDVFARWGGEEFIVLLPQANLEQSRLLAERIRLAVLRHGFSVPERISVSIGVSARKPLESGAALIARADDRLYDAKRMGRNRVVV